MFSDGFPVLILISSIFKGRRQLVDILKYLILKFLLLPTLHLEKEMATHSSILAWKIPWTEESGGLQSMVWQKCCTWLSDWTTALHLRQVLWLFLPYQGEKYTSSSESVQLPQGHWWSGSSGSNPVHLTPEPKPSITVLYHPLLVEGSYGAPHGLVPSLAQVLQFLFINSFSSQAFGVFWSSYVQIRSIHVCWMTSKIN